MQDSDFYDSEYFETGNESGKSLYKNYRWMPEATLQLAHRIIQFMELKPGTRVLDYGCAKGYLVKALRLLDMDAHGVDISAYAIDNCDPLVRKYVRQLPQITTSFYDANYDLVICKDVLEHVSKTELKSVLQTISNLSSAVFIVVPLGNGTEYYIDEYENDKSHMIRENLIWWKNQITKSGCVVECIADTGYFKPNWAHVPFANGVFYKKGIRV